MIKRYAIVENDAVVNVAVSEYPLFTNWIESESASIDDLYIDGEFIKPTTDTE